MARRRILVLEILLLVAVGACGSGSGSRQGSDTELEVDGVATSAYRLPTGSTAPVVPTVPDPGNVIELPFSGTVHCAGPSSTGTGIFAVNPAGVCGSIGVRSSVFDGIGDTKGRVCSEIYGGPQHATIKGKIGGQPVDVTVKRSDGCGIEDWQRLEWLLGTPER